MRLIIVSAAISGGGPTNTITAKATCNGIDVPEADATAGAPPNDFDSAVVDTQEPLLDLEGAAQCMPVRTNVGNASWTITCVFLFQ